MSTGANHIGTEEIINALGRDWRLSRWDRAVWKDWIRWAKGEFPDPVASIRKEMLAYAYEDEQIKTAIQTEQMNPDKTAAELKLRELNQRLAASGAVQSRLAKEAVEAAGRPISIASPKAFELINSPEGSIYLLFLMLKKYQPEVTEDDAAEIFIEKGQEEVQKTFDLAAGMPPIAKKNLPSEAA